ncbi:hypothetical protein O181_067399 [Austropuccinia psidii MF-1]|uniref:Secreted protein n=1 Tax=Austropuccinia psidii MF-1 TaxID=1389203 RepID=A0A9Q3EUV3_9BASI|nr:hypothetical protein [Austropuccinia psidii MF-1]
MVAGFSFWCALPCWILLPPLGITHSRAVSYRLPDILSISSTKPLPSAPPPPLMLSHLIAKTFYKACTG